MLVINNLHKSFKNKIVLNGINLSVKRGEIKGLIGINGAGKSTLVECICGVQKFQQGEILIGGISIRESRNKNKFKFGYMPQSFSLFNDLTVQENLEYLCAIYGIEDLEKVNKTISCCYLTDYAKTLAKNLSGGFKQLLSLASAILIEPNLLILDEPTSAMDPLFRRKFWKIIHKIKNENCAVLVITHYLEELMECKSFACLANGEIAFDKDVNECKKNGILNLETLLKNYSVNEKGEK